jgi:hypothetical protein
VRLPDFDDPLQFFLHPGFVFPKMKTRPRQGAIHDRKGIPETYEEEDIIPIQEGIFVEEGNDDDLMDNDDWGDDEEVGEDEVGEDEVGLLGFGRVLGHKAKAKFTYGVSPQDPLYPGSPHTAKDFCRYLLAMRHKTGTAYYCLLLLFTAGPCYCFLLLFTAGPCYCYLLLITAICKLLPLRRSR